MRLSPCPKIPVVVYEISRDMVLMFHAGISAIREVPSMIEREVVRVVGLIPQQYFFIEGNLSLVSSGIVMQLGSPGPTFFCDLDPSPTRSVELAL